MAVSATVLVTAISPATPYAHGVSYACGHRCADGVDYLAAVDAGRPPLCVHCGEAGEDRSLRDVRLCRTAVCQPLGVGIRGNILPPFELLLKGNMAENFCVLGSKLDLVGYVRENCKAGFAKAGFATIDCISFVNIAAPAPVFKLPASKNSDSCLNDYGYHVGGDEQDEQLFAISDHLVESLAPVQVHCSLALYCICSAVAAACEGDRGRKPLNVLVLGDCAVANRVLADIAAHLPFPVTHQIWNELGPTRSATDNIYDAGSILISAGSVVQVPFLEHIKPKQLSILQQCIGDAYITVDARDSTEFGSVSHSNQSVRVPTSATIWAGSEGHVYGSKPGKNLKELIGSFDLVYECNSVTNSHEIDLAMCAAIFAADDDHRSTVCDIHKILADARDQYAAVELSLDCSKLLQGFYVMSRRLRLRSGRSQPKQGLFNTESLKALGSLAAALAAINGRYRTHILDAVYAVILFEESLVDRYGFSVLGLGRRKTVGSVLGVLSKGEINSTAALWQIHAHIQNSIQQYT